MKMGTCEQPQPVDQQGPREPPREGLNMEENNLTITGPPASRTVIDNLKKLLLQRQHSRESDTENNRNMPRSDPGSNSDAAFYSQFTTSSSDSDDSSDYMIFQEISTQESNSNDARRKHRRRRSYSSSSSSSSSPVARCRRKVTRVNVTLSSSIGGDGETPQKSGLDDQVHINEYNDSANSTSSHKDSSTEDEFPGASNSKSLSSSEEVAPARCAKLKSRRDRDRKRKRYELSYTSHRPKLLKATESTTIALSQDEESTTQSISTVVNPNAVQNGEPDRIIETTTRISAENDRDVNAPTNEASSHNPPSVNSTTTNA